MRLQFVCVALFSPSLRFIVSIFFSYSDFCSSCLYAACRADFFPRRDYSWNKFFILMWRKCPREIRRTVKCCWTCRTVAVIIMFFCSSFAGLKWRCCCCWCWCYLPWVCFLDGVLVQTFCTYTHTHTTRRALNLNFTEPLVSFLMEKNLRWGQTVMRQCVQCREKANDWLPRLLRK